MNRPQFKLWHSILANAIVLAAEGAVLSVLLTPGLGMALVLCISLAGAFANIYLAMEIIDQVRSARHMVVLLSAVVAEFVAFFAMEYLYLLRAQPGSFPTLTPDLVTLVLHSIMVFVFNPLYLPATMAGKALLIINSLGALGLVLFLLQNIWQLRRDSPECD